MFKKHIFKISVITIILMLTAVLAYTHSGRTDKYGGHHNRSNGTYHYHNSGTVPKTRSTTPTRINKLPSKPASDVKAEPKAHTLSPGREKYIPTKLEWLVLQLNANAHDRAIFHTDPRDVDGNTVLINVIFKHRRPAPGDTVSTGDNLFIKTIERHVQNIAKRYGWQSWVKTRVDKLYLGQYLGQ